MSAVEVINGEHNSFEESEKEKTTMSPGESIRLQA